jgi:hypothetical protein
MRGGESTLSRKARRERTAKAERKLLAKNSSMGSVRGRKRLAEGRAAYDFRHADDPSS